MDGIELMIEEHDNIKKGIKATRNVSNKIIDEQHVDVDFFRQALVFFRSYADKHHHGKEEEILFDFFRKRGDDLELNLINGMEIEHNWGRALLKDLETALDKYEEGEEQAKIDIVGNAIAYTNMLSRHIDKENNALFRYAQRNLEQEELEKFNQLVSDFENRSENISKRDNMLELLKELENRT